METDENITAWFTDAAARHPDILHTAQKPRFFEMEWDEIIQSGKAMALPHFALVLEDYEEGMNDNGGDYITRMPQLSFMVLRTVPPGKLALKKETYTKAKLIAESILAKLHSDCDAGVCDADVPTGVIPPVHVLISSVKGTKVGPVPAFDQAFGYRLSVNIRTDNNVDLTTDNTAWVPRN